MSNDCSDCPVLPRVEALEEANRQHSSTHREMFDRLRSLETSTAVQENKLDTIDDKLDDIQTKQKSILDKVEALEGKPGKRWEGLVDKAIWAVVGAVIAFLLYKAGLTG